MLLANGAQVNADNNGGETALAEARGKPEMEALLRQHGAEEDEEEEDEDDDEE